ncbi:hypothetical protein [Methylobacterium oxalidis]|uniref:hypothetical protein n=1 Tax=Methylobacterium oxalidis TaxID=944322 RepID=UPI0033154989
MPTEPPSASASGPLPASNAPACAYMRELLHLLSEDRAGGADRLFLSLLMLELRALTAGASDATLRAIVTARTTAGFASLGGLPRIVRPA